MSTQICPKCGSRGFTWHIDEAVSPLTQWFCSVCRYTAEEDESRLSTCPSCNVEKARLLLSDQEGVYCFCQQCQARSSV
jgi:ssDNA-binding Zn-finger/Zn-ribbon topoisomerase 1